MNRIRTVLTIVAKFSENDPIAAGIGKLLVTTSLLIGLFACGGGSSAPPPPPPNPSAVPFINQPLVPAATAPGGTGFTLTVNGTGFISGSVVNWNGSPRSTTFVSSSQLQASIPASDIAAPGTASVTVVNPPPGGGSSNVDLLEVTLPTLSVSLVGGADYGGGSFLTGMAVGDFNDDGKLDLSVADYDNSVLYVLLGNGDGTLQAPVQFATGGFPGGVAVGDFNGDGKLDLAVSYGCNTSNCLTGGVSILLGNGDGSFETHVDYPAGGAPSGLVAGDFNQDGKLDLAVANYYDGTVSIFLGNGDGTFQPQVVSKDCIACGLGTNPAAVTIGDFNGDGRLDLVMAGDQPVDVLLGNGDGTFQAPIEYTTGNFWGHSVVVADFNADGKLDVALANSCGPTSCNYGEGNVSILIGNGDGTFQPHVDFPGGASPGGAVVGDFNGDAKLDLAVANYGGVSLLLGNGDGTFQAPLSFSTESSPGVAAGDFNGDGRLDLGVNNVQPQDSISVLLQSH
jgi:VCBS repeat protein/IPT/TIG domain-containing protein/FG-GAP repeat protein